MAIGRLSGELREYEDWLDGVEPAWTVLEPARWEALMREPSGEDGALRLAGDLTDEGLDRSAMVRNALVLLGASLWALSTTGDRLQETSALMKLAVLPDEVVKRNPAWVAPVLFAWRVLRPLYWFGLVECAEDSEDLEEASWRKSALFDRFLRFSTDVVRTEGSLH